MDKQAEQPARAGRQIVNFDADLVEVLAGDCVAVIRRDSKEPVSIHLQGIGLEARCEHAAKEAPPQLVEETALEVRPPVDQDEKPARDSESRVLADIHRAEDKAMSLNRLMVR